MGNTEKENMLRNIPSVDSILQWPELQKHIETLQQSYITRIIRDKIEEFRNRIIAGEHFDLDFLKNSILCEFKDLVRPYFRRAVNALGIVLHTGLGRAPYSLGVAEAVRDASIGYSQLQIDEQGRRSDRYKKISRILTIITGAEGAVIVNNNAGATLLILSELAQGKEVIVSRSQLIEIGGAFRIPEIMEQSGAVLREVGTTNRTHLRNYEDAINENTGALLRVHQSNYKIIGFTKEVPLDELVALGRKHTLPVIDDLGSGALIDFSKYGLPNEPTVQESIKTGADIACFSGDKLIGGPQCGIIIGKKRYIDRIKKNPLTRALRCDKMTNEALEITLQLFLHKEEILLKNHGVMKLLLRPIDDIKRHAGKCARMLKKDFSEKLEISLQKDVSQIGGGSLSTEELPTFVIAVKPKNGSLAELARALRTVDVPVYGRVAEEAILLDFRTVLNGEEQFIVQAFKEILS
ncbi:L-seryl-tRNA(Sec) selenium transferase [candidate division WOR-3 bacterium]|nr:L-seryl-tRNA(Sec) selenium transferase [candidate division WOR-3 bacterium]